MKKYLFSALVSFLIAFPAVSHAQVSNTPLTHEQYESDVQLLISLIEQLIAIESQPATTTIQASTATPVVVTPENVPTQAFVQPATTTQPTGSVPSPVVYTQSIETQNTMTGAITTVTSTSTKPY